ncbi:MAG: sigma-54-dependent Fis family transcriptional regulator [Acidobacteria bacterium]|nr:sigma-54-dependent Fis family transcriptional regulator [Acidobacteriota bacterium]MBI3488462.1 sigma-54-dependent Fis family transcriptional regulator [Acidobacteriota bacterium]
MPLATTQRILLVEDEPGLREVLTLALEGAGFCCEAAAGLEEGLRALREATYDGVLSDLKLKDGSGIELLTWMKEQGLDTPVVIMTAYATTETTVQALNQGAVDFITKPFKHEELIATLKGLLTAAGPETVPPPDLGELVGVGHVMRKINALIGKVSRADTTVLITGESGTGKEVVARLIHRHSDRSKGPFVAVNCGALPEALLESELFGFEKGAFTGATAMKRGLFEEAGGGILFLDEIGEMPLALQVKLLRVLQEHKVRRLGATEERPMDVRVIAATNRDLRARAESGAFREDLYYRINILQIEMPPLRERPEDLPVLAEHFIRRFCHKLGKPPMQLHPETMAQLLSYRFPGNVRELENLMERCVALNPGGPITRDLLPDGFGQGSAPEGAPLPAPLGIPPEGFDLEAWIQALKGHFLRKALDEVGGVKTKAGKRLGMSFRAYRYWLAELGGLEALQADFPWPSDFPAPAVDESGGTEGSKEA